MGRPGGLHFVRVARMIAIRPMETNGDAGAVPDLLEVAEAGPAVPPFVEARRAAAAPVEDEGTVRTPPGLLARDHRHQLRCVVGVDRYLQLVTRLVEFRPERECPVLLAVVAPLESPGGSDAPGTEEQELHDVGDDRREMRAEPLHVGPAEEALSHCPLVLRG